MKLKELRDAILEPAPATYVKVTATKRKLSKTDWGIEGVQNGSLREP